MGEFAKTNTFIVLVAYELSTPVKEYTLYCCQVPSKSLNTFHIRKELACYLSHIWIVRDNKQQSQRISRSHHVQLN